MLTPMCFLALCNQIVLLFQVKQIENWLAIAEIVSHLLVVMQKQ